MKVTVLGPNLIYDRSPTLIDDGMGTFHVHAAGCADIDRRYRACQQETGEVASLKQLVTNFYPPSNFDYRADVEDEFSVYANEFYVKPCARALLRGESA